MLIGRSCQINVIGNSIVLTVEREKKLCFSSNLACDSNGLQTGSASKYEECFFVNLTQCTFL